MPQAFQPLIEELEVTAVVERDWPREIVHRVLLVDVIDVFIQSDCLEGAIEILQQEIEVLRKDANGV